ncbi:short-chain dehydrogenase [Catellatospora sp. TT07R-123]|uniref:SDR family NAD(P)-dependent oxidoreductase n=1 Tax=Catellatospora sp. TT07R-123 TaxID=2733863 RepID=UPI001B0C9BEF|nr:SDR family oxidoreductase [Catellatospora sp. TT07R-123]GHJ44227.1 short-chain dehydrogenase [Catellatospora sp. TT07R-123]
MLLANKNAIVHGGAGAIGSAVARAFAREGAAVYLTGRTQSKLDAVAARIRDEGGSVETAQLDAMDEHAVADHADHVAKEAGSIDIVLNAVGIMHVQGTPFAELALDDFLHPINAYTRAQFVTAKAAARHMTRQGSGVILSLSTPGSKLPGPGFLGFGVTCAAIEATSRLLAGELGGSGVRVVCLRPDAVPQAIEAGSYSREVFEPIAARAGVPLSDMVAGAAGNTLLKRLPTLDDVAEAAVFAASDRAAAMTGTVLNLTCGSLVD